MSRSLSFVGFSTFEDFAVKYDVYSATSPNTTSYGKFWCLRSKYWNSTDEVDYLQEYHVDGDPGKHLIAYVVQTGTGLRAMIVVNPKLIVLGAVVEIASKNEADVIFLDTSGFDTVQGLVYNYL